MIILLYNNSYSLSHRELKVERVLVLSTLDDRHHVP